MAVICLWLTYSRFQSQRGFFCRRDLDCYRAWKKIKAKQCSVYAGERCCQQLPKGVGDHGDRIEEPRPSFDWSTQEEDDDQDAKRCLNCSLALKVCFRMIVFVGCLLWPFGLAHLCSRIDFIIFRCWSAWWLHWVLLCRCIAGSVSSFCTGVSSEDFCRKL